MKRETKTIEKTMPKLAPTFIPVAEDLKVVGKSMPKVDTLGKATGAAKYVSDIKLHGVIYGKLLRSPHAHAKIVSINTQKAENLKGVRAVITHKDAPRVLFGECGVEDAYLLPDRARFVGDEIAAVVADSEQLAEKALELIEVKYEPLPAVFSSEDALNPEAPVIPPPEVCDSNLLHGLTRSNLKEWGDVEKGFENSDYIFEATCYTRFIQHMPIEPRACTAQWDGEKMTVFVPSQRPFEYRRSIAKVLGLPENKVKLVSPLIGGSFGSKYQGRYAIIAAFLARKTGKPVRFDFTKEEDMLSKMRQTATHEVKMGLKKDGTFSAIAGRITTASGGYNWSHNSEAVLPLNGLFRCPNIKFESRSLYTNHPTTGEWRGVNNGPMTFAVGQLVDKISEELGFKNPVEFIKKNHIQTGDECSSLWEREGVLLSSCGLDECLERGAEAIGWDKKWKGWKTPVRTEGSKRIGMGVAAMTHHSGPAVFSSSAVVHLNTDGTANFLTPVMESGQGATTTQAQILAESSGIPFKDIHVVHSDTEVTPLDPRGQVGSVSAHVTGLATKLAGEDLRKQVLERFADLISVKPEALDIKEGKIYVKEDPEESITLKELMEKSRFGLTPVIGRGSTTCPSWPQKARNFGAHFGEVEVDIETGELKVLQYVAAHDVGKALNPTIVAGQIEGAAAMGLSWALSEELIFDEEGKALNLSNLDYKIFTAVDCPKIIPIIVEPGDPLGPYGAKAFGEAPSIPVPACIANAIYNAIGIRFMELPITPEKILKALKEGKKEFPS